uniref:Uncharacterized protein n=1 Tax=Candidatus Kentrum sp. LFY TaxID=2126342 RepID=A0A450W7L7_9GAMM|nr:MAG: hypothetical protein BECKLFY1418C_GA0070996_100220 [Candidatus Kentron sp. LFY]
MLPEALPLAVKEVRGAVGQRPPIYQASTQYFFMANSNKRWKTHMGTFIGDKSRISEEMTRFLIIDSWFPY